MVVYYLSMGSHFSACGTITVSSLAGETEHVGTVTTTKGGSPHSCSGKCDLVQNISNFLEFLLLYLGVCAALGLDPPERKKKKIQFTLRPLFDISV